MDYYVLDYNEDRAREHFKQVQPVLACYEHYMGNTLSGMTDLPY
ncbi:MAG: hypothetical protein R2795_00805 [Saprospiraceae bacterium]